MKSNKPNWYALKWDLTIFIWDLKFRLEEWPYANDNGLRFVAYDYAKAVEPFYKARFKPNTEIAIETAFNDCKRLNQIDTTDNDLPRVLGEWSIGRLNSRQPNWLHNLLTKGKL